MCTVPLFIDRRGVYPRWILRFAIHHHYTRLPVGQGVSSSGAALDSQPSQLRSRRDHHHIPFSRLAGRRLEDGDQTVLRTDAREAEKAKKGRMKIAFSGSSQTFPNNVGLLGRLDHASMCTSMRHKKYRGQPRSSAGVVSGTDDQAVFFSDPLESSDSDQMRMSQVDSVLFRISQSERRPPPFAPNRAVKRLQILLVPLVGSVIRHGGSIREVGFPPCCSPPKL